MRMPLLWIGKYPRHKECRTPPHFQTSTCHKSTMCKTSTRCLRWYLDHIEYKLTHLWSPSMWYTCPRDTACTTPPPKIPSRYPGDKAGIRPMMYHLRRGRNGLCRMTDTARRSRHMSIDLAHRERKKKQPYCTRPRYNTLEVQGTYHDVREAGWCLSTGEVLPHGRGPFPHIIERTPEVAPASFIYVVLLSWCTDCIPVAIL